MAYVKQTVEEKWCLAWKRFQAKTVVGAGNCWLWTGALNRCGYGIVSALGRKLKAHQLAWEFHYGSRRNLHVLHRCDVPACVNPEHLWLGTHQDNMKDMDAKRRRRVAVGARHGTKTCPESWANREERGGHVTHPERVLKGEAVKTAKLTAQQVRAILQWRGLRSQQFTAKFFNVSQSTISLIWARKTWRSVQ